MTQPTAFSRGQRFTSYAAQYPAAPFNAAGCDTEFDNVKSTLDTILLNLAVIQRDDTKLKNGSVHADALDATALALFTSGSWTPMGVWVTATDYVLGDVVTNSDQTYICVEAHTAGTFATDLAADKWVALQSAASNVNLTAIAGLSATEVQSAVSELLSYVPTYAKRHATGDISL